METRIPRKVWHPSVTTQFRICPIPFHFDTYRGCKYGCLFCFARDITEFERRNKPQEERRQSYLVGCSTQGLERWVNRVLKSNYNYKNAAMVAFKERIPIKIGATADPFPIVETKERITYECLKIFDKHDYPVQISTKNPEVFLGYADEFVNSNIAFNVSCSFCDDDVARKIEIGAPPPSRRFAAIRKLADMGYKVTVRIQPFILPYSKQVAERFIKTIKDCGAWAFQTEGLKLRLAMTQKEREIYKKIGDVFGFDILSEFKLKGVVEQGDRVYNIADKKAMLTLYTELAEKYEIRFLNADNYIREGFGCGAECCGTEFLRNHKIWGGCLRTKILGNGGIEESAELGKCYANFLRNINNYKRTIGEMSEEFCENELKRMENSYTQLTFDFD